MTADEWLKELRTYGLTKTATEADALAHALSGDAGWSYDQVLEALRELLETAAAERIRLR